MLVAVDFTATQLRLLLATIDGEPVAREEWPLPALPDEESWSWEIGGRIATLLAREGGRRSALAIAVACPGSVDPIAGRVLDSAGQPEWDGLAVVNAVRVHIDAPVAAVSRVHAALMAEAAQGVASDAADALYVSLRGVPTAAVLAAGRVVRGSQHAAGALPAAPAVAEDGTPDPAALERLTALLADATALLDPGLVILEGEDAVVAAVGPLLQRVIDEVCEGPRVVRAALGEAGALVGAARVAATLAYEGERTA